MTAILFTIAAFIILMPAGNWRHDKQEGYSMFYTVADEPNREEYTRLIANGREAVQYFFQGNFSQNFAVFIHPDRQSLDSTWQKDWNMPLFRSECWMVASGVADKMDMISPKRWDDLACEHSYTDSIKTRQLITHELVHVYHGQHNSSPDFSDVSGMDWFVEGLAVYSSGQYDPARQAEVQRAIRNNQVPETLQEFWTGSLRYGLSGSVVKFIDDRYGRTRLTELLQYNRLPHMLAALNTSEQELLNMWKKYTLKTVD